MVTHDPRFAGFADRTIHLFDGKVVSADEAKRLAAIEGDASTAGTASN
jgi:putative ABC transport system ATP-binding protein